MNDISHLLTLASQIAQKQPEALALLNKVYQGLFNETVRKSCGDCNQKAFLRIKKYVYLQMQNNPEGHTVPTDRQYILKPGRSLQTTFGGDPLTNDNLTDPVAEKLIADHPALAKHFDRVPAENQQ